MRYASYFIEGDLHFVDVGLYRPHCLITVLRIAMKVVGSDLPRDGVVLMLPTCPFLGFGGHFLSDWGIHPSSP